MPSSQSGGGESPREFSDEIGDQLAPPTLLVEFPKRWAELDLQDSCLAAMQPYPQHAQLSS